MVFCFASVTMAFVSQPKMSVALPPRVWVMTLFNKTRVLSNPALKTSEYNQRRKKNKILGSGALLGKMVAYKNNKIDAYFRCG